VARATHRWLALADGQVTVRLKDDRQGNRLTTLTLDAPEFIRRFLLHVLPDGFVRIRHFGFLSHRPWAAKLASSRAQPSGPGPRTPRRPGGPGLAAAPARLADPVRGADRRTRRPLG
jgi:hypothetical protein